MPDRTRPARGAGRAMTRTGAELGAGLAAVRPPRAIRRGERIHVIGVGGPGASAAALLAAAAGAIRTGCDAGGAPPYTPPRLAPGVLPYSGAPSLPPSPPSRPLRLTRYH